MVTSRAVAYLAEAETHQAVAARHHEMSREWLDEGQPCLAWRAQQLAAARYAAARDCVDMRACTGVYIPPVPK